MAKVKWQSKEPDGWLGAATASGKLRTVQNQRERLPNSYRILAECDAINMRRRFVLSGPKGEIIHSYEVEIFDSLGENKAMDLLRDIALRHEEAQRSSEEMLSASEAVRREVYTDYDGRTFIQPKNAIKAVVHQSGHFPIDWMVEGSERASESEVLVKIEVSKDGVIVIAHDGDDYVQHELPWTMMDKAAVNPVIPAIEGLEKKLRILRSAKSKMKGA